MFSNDLSVNGSGGKNTCRYSSGNTRALLPRARICADIVVLTAQCKSQRDTEEVGHRSKPMNAVDLLSDVLANDVVPLPYLSSDDKSCGATCNTVVLVVGPYAGL